MNPRAKCIGVNASSPPNWDMNSATNQITRTAMNPIIRAMNCFSSFFSYDPFFLPQCNFSEILRCRHICSSTDRSLPKSSISNAICISSYAQTGIMKTGVQNVASAVKPQPLLTCFDLLPFPAYTAFFGFLGS